MGVEKIAAAVFSTTLAICFGFGTAMSVHAQDEFSLEEISVTADKREQNVQQISIAVSTITGSELIDQSAVSVTDVLKNIAGIISNPTGGGQGYQLSIRGVGSVLPPEVGEGAVATNFDGSYNNTTDSGLFGYFDLDHIEVLRGPQGTLYGRNAVGGVLNIITKNPNTEKIGGYGVIEYGTYRLLREEGALNLPIGEKTAARIAFSNIDRKGFMSTGTGDAVGTAVRTKFAHYPSDDASVVLSVSSVHVGGISGNKSVTVGNWHAGNYYTSTTSPFTKTEKRSYNVNMNASFTVGPGMISFIPSYDLLKRRGARYDTATETMYMGTPQDNTQKSVELRYSAKSDARIQWVTGLYYYTKEFWEKGDGDEPLSWTVGGNSKAAFGQITYPFADEFRLIAGVRWGEEEATLDNRNYEELSDLSENYSGFNWKLGLEYDFADDVMSYFTLATSRRPGGFNSFDTSQGGASFDEERLMSAELGIKSRFMNRRIQVNGNIYYYDYEGYQAVDGYFDEQHELVVQFFNVDKVKNYGAELEVDAIIGDATRFSGSVSYLHSRYDSGYFIHENPMAPPYDMNGLALPHAPDWTLKGALEHTFMLGEKGTLMPNVSARWFDTQFVGVFPGEDETQEAYLILDAYLRYGSASGNWSLNFWIKNAMDEVYKASKNQGGMIVGEPRMLGATLKVVF